ncbi:FAD-binding oxidoreductase [Isoptericola sp. BMS4]|uniref:NAD(P)/FAD-dependent oxidoreductase n=1 Tax=Isoptericola sp. BMS4 TaxID=2527875 RepID=UPI00196B7D9B|nr:FAD-dependent oxidoreductase [Isoptericola sp. BMS4]
MAHGDARGTRPLPAAAEVVVVGGGVMGASVAYHLARDGSDVLLVESGELAGGSSGKPIGGVRAHFSEAANVALGLRSLELFEDFASLPGADIGLEQHGYLFALPTGADVAAFEASAAMQRGLGVDSRMLDVAEARRLNPYLSAGYAGAAWTPRDGWARPRAVVEGYAAGAERHGARVRTHAAVTAVAHDGDRWQVATTRGTTTGSALVLCAGAWSRAVGAMVGLDLPVDPVKRQVAFTAPLDPAPPRLPFTIDFGTTYYLHNADAPGTLLLGASDPDTPVAFDTAYDAGWEPFLHGLAARATPSLADVPLTGGWAGLYETTPDHDALIGEADAPAGGRVLYACGFSGHGFLQGPAVGEAVADLYAGRAGPARRGVDVSAFTAERFAAAGAGAVRHEANII